MSGSTRRAIPQAERMKVWVRSGGRCAICGRYLLEGKLTHQEFSLGELAHIVGQQTTAGSPRGNHDLSAADRDKADNLMLLCAGEHDEIDRRGAVDILTVDRLRDIKRQHEDWIRRMTGLDRNRGTAILRVIGQVRGNAVELSKPTASAAVLHSDDRFPEFPLSFEQYGFEIDLRHLPAEGTDLYWRSGAALIDDVVEHKLQEAVRREAIRHLSVFAFARLPLLVYLGSRLDDTYEVVLYQRHRSTGSWAWPDPEPAAPVSPGTTAPTDPVPTPAPMPAGFEVVRHAGSAAAGSAAAGTRGTVSSGADLVLNVSGTIQLDELPDEHADHPTFVLSPLGHTPGVDTIDSPAALGAFTRAVRTLLSELEATDKQITTLHVFAALPVSAAVALGRARDPHVHPRFVIYDRTADGYRPALEIS